jgi:hypothetical protein
MADRIREFVQWVKDFNEIYLPPSYGEFLFALLIALAVSTVYDTSGKTTYVLLGLAVLLNIPVVIGVLSRRRQIAKERDEFEEYLDGFGNEYMPDMPETIVKLSDYYTIGDDGEIVEIDEVR